jgi:uncharacterized membrane protein
VTIDSKGVPRRQPFCGNKIPSGMMTNLPMVQLINSIMPNPTNGAVTGNNYTYEQVNWNTYRAVTNLMGSGIFEPKQMLVFGKI